MISSVGGTKPNTLLGSKELESFCAGGVADMLGDLLGLLGFSCPEEC